MYKSILRGSVHERINVVCFVFTGCAPELHDLDFTLRRSQKDRIKGNPIEYSVCRHTDKGLFSISLVLRPTVSEWYVDFQTSAERF